MGRASTCDFWATLAQARDSNRAHGRVEGLHRVLGFRVRVLQSGGEGGVFGVWGFRISGSGL